MEGALLCLSGDRNREGPIHGVTDEQGQIPPDLALNEVTIRRKRRVSQMARRSNKVVLFI